MDEAKEVLPGPIKQLTPVKVKEQPSKPWFGATESATATATATATPPLTSTNDTLSLFPRQQRDRVLSWFRQLQQRLLSAFAFLFSPLTSEAELRSFFSDDPSSCDSDATDSSSSCESLDCSSWPSSESDDTDGEEEFAEDETERREGTTAQFPGDLFPLFSLLRKQERQVWKLKKRVASLSAQKNELKASLQQQQLHSQQQTHLLDNYRQRLVKCTKEAETKLSDLRQKTESRLKDLGQQLALSHKDNEALRLQLLQLQHSFNLQQRKEKLMQFHHRLRQRKRYRRRYVAVSDFQVDDVVLFSKATRGYQAINLSSPYYFLSDESVMAFNETRGRDGVWFGRVIFIEKLSATVERNPFSLQIDTAYHVMTALPCDEPMGEESEVEGEDVPLPSLEDELPD